MKKEFDILTALDICVDFLVDCGDTEPEFGQKEKLVSDYGFEMGGSGCIFACQCAKLGLKTVGVGTTSTDSMGEVVINGLNASGVDTSYIRKSNTVKTGLGLSLNKSGGDRAILTYMGTIDKVKTEWLDDLLPKTRHLHICSYYLHKGLHAGYPDIVRKAKQHNVTVSLDSNWDPDENWGGIKELLPYVDVFLPNENELMNITERKNVKEALQYAGEMVPIIAVKCGEKGAYVYCDGTIYESKALKVDVTDTVGAGDSFNGGFIYGMLSKMPIEKCLKAGIVCGSLNTRKPGGTSGQPDLKELLQMVV